MVLVWEPITDLPDNWRELTDGELVPLLQFWNDQRADVEQDGALAEFSARLAREWSIETGQIEGVYELDRGITQTLIERGIDADLIGNHPGQKPPELIAAIIQDHAEVLEGLFQFVKGDRPLTKGYIHELHAGLLRHQETTVVMDQFGHFFESKLAKGKYKERPNNPKKPDGSMHQYCPPEQVDTEMERLLSLHAEHEKKGVPVEVKAAWLHHRFTQIHPYQDGNGRVARALASLIFIKAGWFPVVVTRDDRARYIDALEVADEGELRSFIALLTQFQRRALFDAVQTASELGEDETVEDAIAAARNALTTMGRPRDPKVWATVRDNAERLWARAGVRLGHVSNALRQELGSLAGGFQFDVPRLKSRKHEHMPPKMTSDPTYQDGYSLVIRRFTPPTEWEIAIQARQIGTKFRGIIGIEAFFLSPTTRQILSDTFQVNYAETREASLARFLPWLEESLVKGLSLWRKSL
ncbi:MAG TPA: Fic family protein [Candidatus Angelobacter sp.]|nr:Fic family protein [Candidatus Angelobacter sp.]